MLFDAFQTVCSRRSLTSLVMLLSCAAFTTAAAGRERYVVTLSDGQRIESAELAWWPIPGKGTKIDGRELFDGANPAVLVRDQKSESRLASAALLMANGDVLPGVIQGIEPSLGRVGDAIWLRVQLETNLSPADGGVVRVRADRVRRIIAAGRPISPEPEPGSVTLADGRQLKARSIRWREYGLAMLTETGIVETTYAELADVVLPGVDVLRGIVEDNLSVEGDQTILRYTLAGGGVLTTSRATRVEERTRSRGRRRIDIYYIAQPAWSADAICIPEEEIAWCGYRRADEAPLSAMPAETLAERRLIGGVVPWSRGAAAGEAIATSGSREADLAIATHAHSEIAFQLPPAAKQFSVAAGIADRVGDGGCVRLRIFADKVGGLGEVKADQLVAADEASASNDSPGRVELWDSGFVTGRDAVKESGLLDVAGQSRVILVSEFAHDDRPEGADPLDIRDDVRWLRPIVTLDRGELHTFDALAPLVRGAGAWQAGGDDWARVTLDREWSEIQSTWEPVLVIPAGAELRLSRTLRVASGSDVVELAAACPRDANEHDFSLAVDGEVLQRTISHDLRELKKQVESILPRIRRREREGRAEDPRDRRFDDTVASWWDLSPHRGREVTLTLTLRGGEKEERRIAWRGLFVRSAIGNLPASGELPRVDVPLASLEPISIGAEKNGPTPAKDALPGKRGLPIQFFGQTMTGGYGMVRNSHVTVELKPEYRKFVAVVGAVATSSGPLQVLVDDRAVWHRDLADCRTPAELIEIDLPEGAKRLTILCGNEGSYGGHAGWASAGFVTPPAAGE